MEIPLLTDLVIILGLSVIVILGFRKLKLPNILGFLFTGIIAGPHGLSLVEASHEVEILAEVGVILLLFVIGLEFSLKSLVAIRNSVLFGGGLQVGVTTAVVALIAYQFGYHTGEAVFLGFLFSLSSTAIVLKLIQERGEINSPHGKMALAILIFQDIIVVPMMLFTPILAGESTNILQAILLLLLKAVGIILFVIVSARIIVPHLLYQVAKTKSQELFILTIVVICFAVAWLTNLLGLSLALGAFMAGLAISESDYSHQATANILPFREIFTSIFFVSIGMLLDIGFLIAHIHVILLFTIIVFLLKGALATFAAWILRYPPRTFILVGLSLFQVGEFAFILSRSGIEYGLLAEDTYQYFLSISIVTMAFTPFVIHYGDRIVTSVLGTKLTGRFMKKIQISSNKTSSQTTEFKGMEDHLVVIGFGINGRNVTKAARNADIPYVILELNAETVNEEKEKGEPIYYGDAIHLTVLEHLSIQKARVAVIAISDPTATEQIIANIRELSKTVHLIVRTRFVNNIETLMNLGADEVIPEEFETSIEIFTRVMNKYLVPMDEIEEFARAIRSGHYGMLRQMPPSPLEPPKYNLALPEVEFVALKVTYSSKGIINTPLKDSRIREDFKVNVVGIQRNEAYYFDLHGDTQIKTGDIVYVVGRPDAIADFNKAISG